MKLFVRFAAAAVLVVVVASAARAADVTDPAALFPAGTLAYAELHDPAALAPQLAAVVKGTPLEDSIPFIHGRRDAAKEPRDLTGKPQLALLGLIASPEMLGEFKKLRGVAAGLTGFTAQGAPEGAIAVLTGDSQAAGLAARAFLTLSTVRKVGVVGDVPVYQVRRANVVPDPMTGRPTVSTEKPAEGPHEATFAYIPGLVVVGTSRAAVGEVVTRFQGKAKDALAGTAAFKDAAAHRRPGLFLFANTPEFLAKFDAVNKSAGGVEPDTLGWFRLVANAKAARYAAGCVSFRDSGLSLALAAGFDPDQKSPLRDFLAGPGAKVELLAHAPTPATLAVAVTLPEKDRTAAVVGFLDAVVKAGGELGRLPGDAVKELEQKYKVPLSDGLIGKTLAVTLVVPVKQELPKGARELPVIVLHTEGPAVASGWEDFLPKLVADLSGAGVPQPSAETVDGVRVLTVPGGGLPWKAAVHYARKDGVFALGLDRKLVAAAVAGGSVSPVSLPPGDAPAVLGAVSLGGLVRAAAEPARHAGPVVPAGPVKTAALPTPDFGFRHRGFVSPNEGNPTPPEEQKKAEAAAWEALLKAIDSLPVATVTARRAGAEVRVELWQPKVQGGLAPAINAAIGWFDTLLNRTAGNPNGNPNQLLNLGEIGG